MPKVEYSRSFVKAFPLLSTIAKADVSQIGAKLATDAYYAPWEDTAIADAYIGTRLLDGSGAVCCKVAGWDDWKLSWYYEFGSIRACGVEVVILQLHSEPTELSELKLS